MFSDRHPDYDKYKALKGGIYTIEGIIGVGKTTMGRSLEKYINEIGLKARFYPEYVNRRLLGQYISDMKKYAYSFQLIMLFKRIEIYREAEKFASKGGIAFIDRSIIGDMTFARMQCDNGNFTEDEWKIYLSTMEQEIQLRPTASIYLQCTCETSLKRILNRGIEAEIKGYSEEYINQLAQSYDKSMEECKNVKHIIIDWNGAVKIENNILCKEIINMILSKLLDV